MSQVTKEYLTATLALLEADLPAMKPETHDTFHEIKSKIEMHSDSRFKKGQLPISFDELMWLMGTVCEMKIVRLTQGLLRGLSGQA